MGLLIFFTIFSTFKLNVENIPWNIVIPIEYCYEYVECYAIHG